MNTNFPGTKTANSQLLADKIEQLRNGGVNRLHIISDFDLTLSRAFLDTDGVPSATSWEVFKTELTPAYQADRDALYAHYHPIEIDNNLDKVKRDEYMVIWWNKHLDLLKREGITQETIDRVLGNRHIMLRPSVEELFALSASEQIPFLIFSAGLGDVIKTHLADSGLLTTNIHILSNFFHFDDQGKICGFQKEAVHVHNKNESLVATEPFYQEVSSRRNVILMGDSLGDCQMAEGVNHDTVLRIGFLNGHEKRLQAFMSNYDLVILDKEAGVDVVNQIIDYILG